MANDVYNGMSRSCGEGNGKALSPAMCLRQSTDSDVGIFSDIQLNFEEKNKELKQEEQRPEVLAVANLLAKKIWKAQGALKDKSKQGDCAKQLKEKCGAACFPLPPSDQAACKSCIDAFTCGEPAAAPTAANADAYVYFNSKLVRSDLLIIGCNWLIAMFQIFLSNFSKTNF